MADNKYLIARLRPRDRDILLELEKRKLAQGEMADMVREGFRRVLFDNYEKPKALDPIFADLTEKDPDNPMDIEILADNLFGF